MLSLQVLRPCKDQITFELGNPGAQYSTNLTTRYQERNVSFRFKPIVINQGLPRSPQVTPTKIVYRI